MIRRPPRSTQSRSSAASDVYKRQVRLGEVLTTQVDHSQLGREVADVDAPDLVKPFTMRRDGSCLAEPVIGSDQELPGAARRIQDRLRRAVDAEGDDEIGELCGREVLAQQVSLFDRNEMLEDGTQN